MPNKKNLVKDALSDSHSKVEAILFLENTFISHSQLMSKTDLDIEVLKTIILDLNEYYNTHNHAFHILEENDNYLMAINQELSIQLAHLYKAKNTQKLSKALLETLSVIAYSQPITKPEIDELRGVNSDSAIKMLISQNLIKILGKKPIPGNPNQYSTTGEFLRVFGLKSIKDLPKMKEHEIKTFQSHENKESLK